MPHQHCASAGTHNGTHDGIRDVHHHRLGKALRALKKWKVKCEIEEKANQELGRRLKQSKLAFEEERMKREEAELQLYKMKRKQHRCFSELTRETKERLIIEGQLQTTMDRMKQLEHSWVHNKRKSMINLTTDGPLIAPAPAFSINELNGPQPCNEETHRELSFSEDNVIFQQFASLNSEDTYSSFSSRSRSSVKNRQETLANVKCNPSYHDKPDAHHSRSSSITTSHNDCTIDDSDLGKTLCYSLDTSSFKSGSQPGRFCWDNDHKVVRDERYPLSEERCTLF